MLASRERTPLVGREQELTTLLARLAAAGWGEGGLVLVAGEPGIGKTRLVAKLAERARAAGWLVLSGAATDAEGMPPYLPFIEALQDYARDCSTEALQAQLGPSAVEVALLLPEVRQRLPDLPASPPLDAEQARYRLFESVADFVLAIARAPGAAALLLWLEDLHWANEATLLLLEHLGRRSADAPLLVVATYRDTELETARPLAHTVERLTRQGAGSRAAPRPPALPRGGHGHPARRTCRPRAAGSARAAGPRRDRGQPLLRARGLPVPRRRGPPVRWRGRLASGRLAGGAGRAAECAAGARPAAGARQCGLPAGAHDGGWHRPERSLRAALHRRR